MSDERSPAPHLDLGGGSSVSFVVDGTGLLVPRVFLPTLDWDAHGDLLDERGLVAASLGGLLVRTPTTTALVDTGYGPGPPAEGPGMRARGLETFSGGALLENLQALGVTAEQVDLVVVTHVHFDHVGWLVDGAGAPVFPRARLVVSRTEWETASAAGDPHGHLTREGFFDPVSRRVELVAPWQELAPGVKTVPTPGHTNGHLAVEVRGADRRALVIGDAAHVPLELLHPEHGCRRDVDPVAAEASRRWLSEQCRDPRVVLVGGHFAEAPFGRVEGGAEPRWVPVVD